MYMSVASQRTGVNPVNYVFLGDNERFRLGPGLDFNTGDSGPRLAIRPPCVCTPRALFFLCGNRACVPRIE